MTISDPLRHAALVEAAKALEPFKDLAVDTDSDVSNCEFVSDYHRARLNIGHCRAAAAARAALLAELAREPAGWTDELPPRPVAEYDWRVAEFLNDQPAPIYRVRVFGGGDNKAYAKMPSGVVLECRDMGGFWRGPILCPAAPVPPPAARGGKAGEK